MRERRKWLLVALVIMLAGPRAIARRRAKASLLIISNHDRQSASAISCDRRSVAGI